MKEYVTGPVELLEDTEALKPYVKTSYARTKSPKHKRPFLLERGVDPDDIFRQTR